MCTAVISSTYSRTFSAGSMSGAARADRATANSAASAAGRRRTFMNCNTTSEVQAISEAEIVARRVLLGLAQCAPADFRAELALEQRPSPLQVEAQRGHVEHLPRAIVVNVALIDAQTRAEPPGMPQRKARAESQGIDVDARTRLMAQDDRRKVVAAEKARGDALERDGVI